MIYAKYSYEGRRMFRGIWFYASILFLHASVTGQAFAQAGVPSRNVQKPAPAAPFMIEAESYEESQRVKKTVFKNGLTVLIYESGAQPLVSIRTYVFGGFRDDPEEIPGLSEITARLREIVGEGSPTGSIRERAHALGGVFQSGAGPRYSRFEITVPSARWKQALTVQAEAMLTPFQNNEAFSRHVSRIADHMWDEAADVIAEKELRASAFGENRFADSGNFQKIPQEKIIEFHKNRYILPAMTVVIAGDVRAGEVLNEIVRVFVSKSESLGDAKNLAAAPLIPAAGKVLEPAGEFRYRKTSGGIAFPKVLFGFPVSSENSDDYRALEVTAAILGIGETSVLNMRLRDRKNLVFTARAEIESLDGAGFFSVELETEPQNIDMAEIAFWTEVEILKNDGLSEVDLARAVAQLERLWWERRETVGELADTLARFEFNGGWKRMDGYIAEIRKVTVDDVKRVIARYLTLSNCALLEHMPRIAATERNPTAAALRATFESLLRPAMNEELNARAGEIEPGYKIPPVGAAFRPNEIRHSFQPASILRGPEIYIREDHTSPLVEMGVYFTGGKAFESEANAGITGLMLELMLSNERENRQLEIYGGRLTPILADDYFGFFLSIPSRNFSGGFERIKQAIKSPIFDKAEIEKLKKIAAARARLSTTRDEAPLRLQLIRRIDQALFRGHSYAVESSATPVSLANISEETLRDWYEENVRNIKPFVAIVGDTEGSSLASWFVSEFSGSRMNDGKRAVPLPKTVGKAETIISEVDALRSTIMLGFRAPSAGDMDSYGMFVLKGYVENRMRETEWRFENNGERETAYRRIDCEYRPLLSGGSFVISADVKTGYEKRAAEILREEIERLVAQPLSRADFNAARALAVGSYTTGNQLRMSQIENLAKNMLAGRSLGEHQNFSRSMEQFEENDFNVLMRRVLDMNKSVTVAGGDS